jgi:hypothetical protein
MAASGGHEEGEAGHATPEGAHPVPEGAPVTRVPAAAGD